MKSGVGIGGAQKGRLHLFAARLPDLSWSKIPKRGKIHQIAIKYTKWPLNISNGRKKDQMLIKYSKIFLSKTLQNLPKLVFLV
jgi:hypothetical protein